MKKLCGIYKITNKINGKCYIGQSNDIHRRWKQELAPNAKLNPHLARAFEKYGIDNFEFEIIEEAYKYFDRVLTISKNLNMPSFNMDVHRKIERYRSAHYDVNIDEAEADIVFRKF